MIKDLPEINSDYFICVAIKKSSLVRNELINPLVARFFEAHSIENYEELPLEDCFADIEYSSLTFDQIYSKLLVGIKKHQMNISFPVKFILTIDKENCSQRCKKTDIFYDTIEINDTPFLYFIYIDISAIITTMRKSNSEFIYRGK